ncbi:MAG: putative glycoside hydrolase [Oscillospiraceae bacterium]|nr:putative glycoside hydrolase [Oscillospiraceae bacterium]
MAKKYRKVKRSRNLYKKRKGSARKAIEIILMVALVGGLGLIGFAAGKPLFEFLFSDRGEEEVLEWTPPEDVEPDGSEDIITQTEDEPVDEDDEPPVSAPSHNAVFAPASVLDNSTSLAAYIQQAKSNGYNAVVLDMKDTTGNLFYASMYEPVKNTEIIKGTLTAAQIFAVFEGTEVTPIARINTLFDQLSPRYVEDVSYAFADGSSKWMDNRPDAGGKFWANPFLQGTRDYISFLVEELAEAGFPEIILANNIFPYFRPYDVSILNPEFTNINTRYQGLLGLVDACAEKKGSSKLILEMSLKDVVENYSGFNNSAEILRGKNNLGDASLLLVFTRSDFGEELITGENSSVILPRDISGLVNMLYKQAQNQIPGLYTIPGLVIAGLTDGEITDILRTFGELEFESYMIK